MRTPQRSIRRAQRPMIRGVEGSRDWIAEAPWPNIIRSS